MANCAAPLFSRPHCGPAVRFESRPAHHNAPLWSNIPVMARFLALLFLGLLATAQQTPDAAALSGIDPALRTSVSEALKAREFLAAEKLLAAHLEQHPDPRIYTFLGSLFFFDHQYLNAGIALKKADVLQPLAEPDRFTLAMCYVVLNMPDRAQKEMLTLSAQSPTNSKYPYWLARIHYDAKNYDDAVKGFRKALALDPGFVRAWDNLGLTYEALGQNDDAIAGYKKAIEANRRATPCSPWPGHNLATLLRKIGRPEEAEPVLRGSLACDPKFARSHYQLGVILEKDEAKTAEAIEHLRRAEELDPNYAEPHYTLGRLLRRLGRDEEAAQQLKTFEELKARQDRDSDAAKAGRSTTKPLN